MIARNATTATFQKATNFIILVKPLLLICGCVLLIQSVFKKYQDWSCIYQDRNEQWMKHSFSLKQFPSHSKHLFQRVFLLSKCPWNTSFHMVQNCVCFNRFSHPQILCLRWISSLGNKKKSNGERYFE